MNNIREVEKEAAMLHWTMRELYNDVKELNDRVGNLEYVLSKNLVTKK